MDRPLQPAFRSTSLPGSSTARPYTAPLNTSISGFAVGQGPITPPLSPGRSDEGDPSLVIDTEPRYSGGGTPPSEFPAHGKLPAAAEEAMDVDPEQSASSPKPPLRRLEDEQSHLTRGSLKLTDFEVKGTLGLYPRNAHSGPADYHL